jgi:hypothetical protein
MNTDKIVSSLVSALVDSKADRAYGASYALGYLEVTFSDIVRRYVKDEFELKMLHIELLNKIIDAKLNKTGA